MQTKHCKRCDRTLPITRFHRDKKSKDGHTFYCKDCVSKMGKKYRQTASGIYHFMKGDVRKRKPVKISLKKFKEWYDSQPKKCIYCGITKNQLQKVDDSFNNASIKLTVDCMNNELGYVEGNLVLSCRRCNWIKGDFFTYEQMLEIGEKYIKPRWKQQLGHKI